MVSRIAPRCVAFGLLLVLTACGEHDPRARASDPYQACLDRAYSAGDLGIYDRPTLQHGFPSEREIRQSGVPYPSRLNWPQSAADRCSDLRARGLL